MDTFARISQPAGLAGYMRQNRQGAGDSFDQFDTTRKRANERGEQSDGRGFQSILERMIAM